MKTVYISYLDLIAAKLTEFYHLTPLEAHNAAYNSGACKMLEDETSANWQMHQPLMFTVKQVYCQYKGLEIPF